ncbi:MAG: GspH/FimT family pseudopilin [Ectothiorhodospiraceae bacterium]|nr:GspH/FimT family pseudopilin [Ectothiorhodospiraceae bacterium]
MIQSFVNQAPTLQPTQGGKKGKQTGFTLIELMITMSIAAILLTVAVPSFNTTIANNRLATHTNSLVTDLNVARSEAVKRGTTVVLCSSSNPNAAAPTCIGSGNIWTSGWIVFVNGTGDTDASQFAAATDTLLKVSSGATGTTTVLSGATLNVFNYRADGTNSGAVADFAICDDRGVNFGRQVQIRTTGRPRLISGDATTPLGSCTSPS